MELFLTILQFIWEIIIKNMVLSITLVFPVWALLAYALCDDLWVSPYIYRTDQVITPGLFLNFVGHMDEEHLKENLFAFPLICFYAEYFIIPKLNVYWFDVNGWNYFTIHWHSMLVIVLMAVLISFLAGLIIHIINLLTKAKIYIMGLSGIVIALLDVIWMGTFWCLENPNMLRKCIGVFTLLQSGIYLIMDIKTLIAPDDGEARLRPLHITGHLVAVVYMYFTYKFMGGHVELPDVAAFQFQYH